MIKTLVRKLIWPGYLVAMCVLGFGGVKSYIHATTILGDHTVVSAPIELVDVSSRTRRGHTSTTYSFTYTYRVDGQDYSGDYGAVNDKGERYLEDPQMKVAYANSDPAKSGALHQLQRNSTLGGLLFRLLIAFAIMGFLALLIYGWSLPDEEDDDVTPGTNAVPE